MTKTPYVKMVLARRRKHDAVAELKRAAALIRRRYDRVQHIWTRETAMIIADWMDERAARIKRAATGGGR